MNFSQQIAKHLREVYFGGNWTTSCLRDQLKDVSWVQAVNRIGQLHSIAELTYHINYYVRAVGTVLNGGQLNAADRLSFHHPEIQCADDWKQLQDQCWKDGEALADRLEKLEDSQLKTVFCEEKYGIQYRNYHGLIEHAHYHLGQITVLKSLQKQGSGHD